MAKEALKIKTVHVNYTIQYQDPNSDNPEDLLTLNEHAQVNFDDPKMAYLAISEKPYLSETIPALLKRFEETTNPTNKSISEIISKVNSKN